MNLKKEVLSNTWEIELKAFKDLRGSFVKTYIRDFFEKEGLDFQMAEDFYSLSQKDVIRGMHFQLPPHDHDKLIYCPVGRVEDVLLDLRAGSDYGKFASVTLSGDEPSVLFVPKGVAHGFKSLTDNSMLMYKTSTVHAPAYDRGIRWDSFGYDWGEGAFLLSDRDLQHPSFSEFITPF